MRLWVRFYGITKMWLYEDNADWYPQKQTKLNLF